MLTLYSYPELFGVADNNGYGLKVFAFLKLAGVPFTHEHVFDASTAPRGQLPYIVDDGETVGVGIEDETGVGWGEAPEPDDEERLRRDRPPHWDQ